MRLGMLIRNAHCFLALCLITLSTGCGPSKEELRLAEENKAKGLENAKLLQESQLAKAENVKLAEQVRTGLLEKEKLSDQLKAAISENRGLAEKLTVSATENAQLTEQVKITKATLSEAKAKAEKLEENLMGIAKAKKQEEIDQASKAKLTVQAGVTMQSGDTKPASNAEVFVTKKTLEEIMPFAELRVVDFKGKSNKDGVSNTADAWGKGVGKYANSSYVTVAAQIEPRVRSAKITSTRTDFNGTAEFLDLPPGTYFIHCATSLGGGAAWSLKLEVKAGQNKIFLSNENMAK